MFNILDDRKKGNSSFLIGGGGDVSTEILNNYLKIEDALKITDPDLLVSYVTPIGYSPLNISSSPEKDASGLPSSGVTLNFYEGVIDKFGLWAGAFPSGGGFRNRMKITGNEYLDKKVNVTFGATAIFKTVPTGVIELIIMGETRLKNGAGIRGQRIWTQRMIGDSREGYLNLKVENYFFDSKTFIAQTVNYFKSIGRKFTMPDGSRFLETSDLEVWVSASMFQNSDEMLKLITCTMFMKKLGEG